MIYGFQDCKIIPNSSPDGQLLVVDGSGVIYDVNVPTTFLKEAPEHMSRIYVYHHQTERSQTLYGFNCLEDKELFTELISVDGFGPSSALKLMSSFTPAKIRIVIADGDTTEMAKAKGLGKKTADKIVLKLSEKYAEFKTPDGDKTYREQMVQDNDSTTKEVWDIAYKSLLKLGFASRESKDAVQQVICTPHAFTTDGVEVQEMSVGDMASVVVREALKIVSG